MAVKCGYCRMVFDLKTIRAHHKYIHKTEHLLLKCTFDECERTFSNLNSLRKHASIHTITSSNNISPITPEDRNASIEPTVSENLSVSETRNRYALSEIASHSVVNHETVENSRTAVALRKRALALVSDLSAERSIPRIQLQRTIQSFHDFLNNKHLNSLFESIVEEISLKRRRIVRNSLQEFQNSFKDLNSKHQRMKKLKNHGYLPIPISDPNLSQYTSALSI